MFQIAKDVYDVGIDWLTCTTPTLNATQQAQLAAAEIIDEERNRGNVVRPWSMAGFEGLKCGQIQCGNRGHEFIVRLSGGLAQQHFRRFHELEKNVSRLDLQVTASTLADAHRVIIDCAKRASKFKRQHNHRATLTLITSDDNTATLYIGKRSSNYYGRLYAKGLMPNSPYPQDAVRAELELKGKAANYNFERICCMDHERPFVLQQVSSWFGCRGLPLIEDFGTFAATAVFAPPSDYRKRLAWITAQVAPSARMLVHANLGPELLRALGLEVHGPTVRVIGEHN